MKKIILVISVIITYGCIHVPEKDTAFHKKNEKSSEQYTIMHSFKDKKGNAIGIMYASMIKENIFTSLIIVGAEKTDTLYTIQQNIFSNKKGVDFKVNNNHFYGYKLELKKDDYFVTTYLQNEGRNVSDPITIEWNDLDKVFEKRNIPL